MSLEMSQGATCNAKTVAAYRCDFNREDAEAAETDYAYGFRYCDGDDP